MSIIVQDMLDNTPMCSTEPIMYVRLLAVLELSKFLLPASTLYCDVEW